MRPPPPWYLSSKPRSELFRRSFLVGDIDFTARYQLSITTIKNSSFPTSTTWAVLKYKCLTFYFRLHVGESATPGEIKEFCKGQVRVWTDFDSESCMAFFHFISCHNVVRSFSDFSF